MCFITEASTLPRKFNIFGFLSQPLNFASYGMRVFNKTWRGRENAPKMCSPNEFCGISQPSGKSSRRKLYENVESFFYFRDALFIGLCPSLFRVPLSFSEVKQKKSLSKSFMQTWYV